MPIADGATAVLVFTTRADGDLAVGGDAAALAPRRAAIVDAPWTWLRQVHGASVVRVSAPGEHAGEDADAAITDVAGAPIAVHAADCAPIALVGERSIGVVHAGWHGLVEGVVGHAVTAMRDAGDTPERAVLGPCIRPDVYEFGEADLDRVAAVLGDGVRSRTAAGAPALDLAAGVGAALRHAGVGDVDDLGLSTADGDRWFSHRLRQDVGRHALVAWIER
jgi:copper oxidase (laccase) domain-containing protein